MSKEPKNIEWEEWVKGLVGTTNEKPDGSFTLNDVMEKTGRSKSHISNLLSERVKSGELIKGQFVENGNVMTWFIINKKANVSKRSTTGNSKKNKRNSKAK